MSFEYWVAAEKWYEGYAGIVLIAIIMLVFVMGFALTRRKTKTGKRVILGTSILSIGLGAILLINNNRYEDYLAPSQHVTPVIRNQEYKFLRGYQPILRSQEEVYTRYHDPEGVAATGLYEEEVVTIPLEFLGKHGRHYFFEHEGEVFRQYENTVTFDANAEQTQMFGKLFHLKDRQYETIGFHDTEYVFYEGIVIAEEDTAKEYFVEEENLIPNTKAAFYEWTFPYY